MYKLNNRIRDYAWGSTTLIADYLGRTPSGAPEAEMWIGAHPGAPSVAVLDTGCECLNELIGADPEGLLGPDSHAAFGSTLPFLMKVLAAESPLSLQVHPTREQAASGFAAEDALGVPKDAQTRNYKDPNHKPEMILALTDFEALCGFRPASETKAVFDALVTFFRETGAEIPEVLQQASSALASAEDPTAIRQTFTGLIRGGDEVSGAVDAVAALLGSAIPEGPHTAALKTALELSEAYPGDPGVLISLMLNRVSLRPNEAVYLPAGNIHAYLHGLGIEVMASSDNVLRGGLTAKHIDVEELLRTVDFTPLPVPRLAATSPAEGHLIWQPPFDEFQLQRIELEPRTPSMELPAGLPVLVLVASGSGLLDTRLQTLELGKGDSAFVGANENPITLRAGSTEPLVAFVATTGIQQAIPHSRPARPSTNP
ncbi:mannose-6-phosphate isomerase, class I [Arthrobacter sp. W4I7]|uniref:mannose-6-phosphate isomerase, class I n=1 Tax=Arthrobacter sp. W4I7 TaxID=3042296 RepID=UPI00277FEADB|nr:mannose-6-phosphate isomerase, class I [Arthrobacter sp. W4I7]MDQ0691182.1 mannose-6-phosphate isomerase [Arthrobacter sp. W4I7]